MTDQSCSFSLRSRQIRRFGLRIFLGSLFLLLFSNVSVVVVFQNSFEKIIREQEVTGSNPDYVQSNNKTDSAYGFNVKLISKKVKLDESQLIQERLSDRIAHGPFLGCDGLIRDMALPYAPAAFHPKVLNWTRQYSSTEMCKTKDVWNATCCQTVYFWGSGKCGSTTMAMLLKHDPNVGYKFYDPTSGFVDGGKEACWAQSSSGQKEFFKLFPKSKCGTNTSECGSANSDGQTLILDGCPRYSRITEARKIFCANNDAKFVMMVRDPVLTAISAHNDNNIIRGARARGSQKAKQTVEKSQYHFGEFAKMLKSLLQFFPPENVLIVQVEYLKNESYLQSIMDAVQTHFGAVRRKVKPLQANKNQENPNYTLPSYVSLKSTLTHFCEKSFGFYELVGFKMDWMHSMQDRRTTNYTNEIEKTIEQKR
ncbi:uncharacterized protein LOC134854418 isoform X2 [Symsagittifera roscoffensis]|uniref:uncharacterized protein LOC134854418 isoform X2 n=1 Tax=Symsagittifera roscoffensis TaxID=84072 RepID=UPI00307C73B6